MGSETGMGDPILANAIWIHQYPSKSRALAVTRNLTLKQDPQYQMQGFVRYKFNDRAAMHIGYSRLWGGQRTVDGTDLVDESRQAKILLGGSYFVTPKALLLATLGRDISVENGFKEASRFDLRVLYIF